MAEKRKKANESGYYFLCDGIAPDLLMIREFTGTDRCSDLYRFDLSLISSDKHIDITGCINKRATLFIFREGAWMPVSGIVAECAYESITVDYTAYRVILRPTLFLTTLTTQCRVFQKMTVPEIVQQVLDETGLTNFCEMHLDATYPQQEYVVQYNETDFNFISRLMESNGIWYCFNEDPVMDTIPKGIAEQERCIITDTPSIFQEIPFESTIKYRPITEMTQYHDNKEHENIFNLRQFQQGIPSEAIVKNYRYTTPETDISSIKTIPGGDTGSVYHYGGSFQTVPEAERAATIIAHRIASSKTRVAGKSTCKGLRSGYRMTVIDHVREELNQPYIITAVTHHGKMAQSKGNDPAYSNDFEGFPSDNAAYYRPSLCAQKPPIPEIITARIEGNGPQYATLDDKGRYKIRMPFDLSSSAPYQASSYIRLAQLYSGSNYGAHFPVHEGTEMIIVHVNGDPDQPVGLKVVPDSNTISPVIDRNHTEAVIRTAGKNEICMDDIIGKEHLKVFTPGDMIMTSGHNESESANGDRSVKVGGNEKKTITENDTLTVKGKRTIEIKGNRTAKITGSFKTDVTGAATISTTGNYNLEVTGNSEEIFSATRTLEVTGNNRETVTGTHAIEATVTSTVDSTGNMTIEAGKDIGAISNAVLIIKGTTVSIKGGTDLGVGSGPSSIVMTSDGIALNGPITTMMAGMIESSAQTNNNVTGLVVMLN
jgi:type VI secretion system secreted protein VgrG